MPLEPMRPEKKKAKKVRTKKIRGVCNCEEIEKKICKHYNHEPDIRDALLAFHRLSIFMQPRGDGKTYED